MCVKQKIGLIRKIKVKVKLNKNKNEIGLTLIGINVICEVPFILCVSAKNVTLLVFNKERKIR